MARKARQRISYVLPLSNSSGGHRLGVNGLAVDSSSSILYSGGRDGVICAWDLNLNLKEARSPPVDGSKKTTAPATVLRQQVQAHTHWINDIALSQSNTALLSASSDITVKLWRPAAEDPIPPSTVGLHSDYVKVLAVPEVHGDWIASGGLDRKICLWDLSGSGQKLSIEVAEDDGATGNSKDKGSVYALDATHNILASGGPESVVRVWDPKSGKRITKFVGHTDNIRDIMISRDGETLMSASSDHTVKIWSMTAGRCMHTLTMHDASVWCLWSEDPNLSVFYSSDKNGLVAKTDTRDCADIDEGLSVALCQETEGVHKLACAGDYVWTATSRPSINRWSNVDLTNAEPEGADTYRAHRVSVSTARSRLTTISQQPQPISSPRPNRKQVALKHVLRLSNTAYYHQQLYSDNDTTPERTNKRGTVQIQDADSHTSQAINQSPEFVIEGQNGLIKHHMLSDRRRVLTLDTAGEVLMWDLMKCVPIKSFGKRHIEDVQPEVSAMESVPNWCSIDTRTGSLAITLDENSCFDAELYADELDEYNDIHFKEDQRINLGKWILRYLFAGVIIEEIKRDQICRAQLLASQNQQRLERANAPTEIKIPPRPTDGWQHQNQSTSDATPKVSDLNGWHPTTPGLAISLATPGILTNNASVVTRDLGSPIQEEDPAERDLNGGRHSGDYFSANGPSPNPNADSPNLTTKEPATPTLPSEEGKVHAEDSKDGAADPKDTSSKFGKKFRMNMSFSMKKLGRTNATDKDKATKKDEKEDNESDTQSEKTDNSRQIDDNFSGSVQKIQLEYKDKVHAFSQQQAAQDAASGALGAAATLELETLITPSLPSETPVLKPPPATTIIIQEDRPEAGGTVDLYEGNVGNLADHVDQIEKYAPLWLGDILLRNQLPAKEIVKISFVLDPWQNQLPQIATDGNNRLNANRMLRARKILSYIAERIEPAPPEGTEVMAPEEYLELWCNNQRIPPKMTLATIRAHIWRGGGDVSLYYKSNGKKHIAHHPQPPAEEVVAAKPAAT